MAFDINWNKSSASDIAAQIDRANAALRQQVGMPAQAPSSSGYGNMTPNQAQNQVPQSYSPTSSYSGGSSPWQSYNPPAMSQSYSPPPAPSTAKVNMPQYNAPASSYTGSASVIGNTSSFGSDMNKGYQGIFDSVRASDPTRNQINTWSDNKGNIYDTTKMTAQQIFAMGLAKDNNPNAAAILKGMGLDMNGNPTSPMPTYSFGGGPMSASQASSSQGMSSSVNAPPPPAYTKNANVDAMPIDQQLSYYKANPAEAQQEIARATGIGGAGAMGWANQIRGVLPQGGQTGQSNSVVGQQGAGQTQVGQTPNGGFFPAPANPYGSLSPEQIQAQAAAKVQSQIADRSRIASQTKAGYQSSFDRLKSTTNDSRTLENVQNARNLNPFSGRSDYAQGMIARERETTDRQNQQDLQTRLGGVDSQLADFLNQTPEMQQQIINDMTKQERDYFLQTNAQALQAQDQQFNQSQVVKQQHIDLANTLSQQYGVPVYPTDDPMLSYAQVAGIPTVAAQKMAMDAQNSNFDNAIKKALAENTINKSQADIMQQAQQLAISQQNANTSAASQGTAADRLKSENQQNELKNKQASYQSAFDNLKSIYTSKDTDTGAVVVNNQSALREAIIAKNLPDDVTIQLLKDFGLPIRQ